VLRNLEGVDLRLDHGGIVKLFLARGPLWSGCHWFHVDAQPQIPGRTDRVNSSNVAKKIQDRISCGELRASSAADLKIAA
jgi:hypothetical protein